MAIALLVIGLLATAIGFITIGFGIPINAFSLGNTLILAGTITVSTGLILIGLAAAIGQLRRVVAAVSARPVARPAARPAVSGDAAAAPVVKVIPAAPTPVSTPPENRAAPDPRLPEPVLPEPRLPEPPEPRVPEVAPPDERPAPGPLDWLRARPKPASSAAPAVAPASVLSPPQPSPPEPPVVEEGVPLSPRPPPRQAPYRSNPADSRPAPRVEHPMPRATPQVEMSRATPQVEPPKNKDDFDVVWPDRAGQESARRDEGPRREPEMPRAPTPARQRESAPPTPRPAPAERGPAILKSGVIDGMPYTLYADGSIEAELSQGTVKFASVDALRAHLEKQS